MSLKLIYPAALVTNIKTIFLIFTVALLGSGCATQYEIHKYNPVTSQKNAQDKVAKIIASVKAAELKKEDMTKVKIPMVDAYSSITAIHRFASDNLYNESLKDFKDAIDKEFTLQRYALTRTDDELHSDDNFSYQVYFLVGDGSTVITYSMVTDYYYDYTERTLVVRYWGTIFMRNISGAQLSLAAMKSELDIDKYDVSSEKIDTWINSNAKSVVLANKVREGSRQIRLRETAARRAEIKQKKAEQKARSKARSQQHMVELQNTLNQNNETFSSGPNYIKEAEAIRSGYTSSSSNGRTGSANSNTTNGKQDADGSSGAGELDCSIVIRNGSGEFNIGPKLHACGGGGETADACRAEVDKKLYPFLLSYVSGKGRSECKEFISDPSNSLSGTGEQMSK